MTLLDIGWQLAFQGAKTPFRMKKLFGARNLQYETVSAKAGSDWSASSPSFHDMSEDVVVG